MAVTSTAPCVVDNKVKDDDTKFVHLYITYKLRQLNIFKKTKKQLFDTYEQQTRGQVAGGSTPAAAPSSASGPGHDGGT